MADQPDVVFEGGNAARMDWEPCRCRASVSDDASRPNVRSFAATWATSAATSLASRMAAQIMAQYPTFAGDRSRIDSPFGRGTQEMKRQFLPGVGKPNKGHYLNLFGTVDTASQTWTARWEPLELSDFGRGGEVAPFAKEPGKDVSLRDMHLFELPWPIAQLEALGDAESRCVLRYRTSSSPTLVSVVDHATGMSRTGSGSM